MKVFISGPMTGLPEWNFPKFNEVEKKFQEAGHEVVNPVRLFESMAEEERGNWSTCIRLGIKALMECEAIVMLPGWTHSRGAVTEAALARNIGIIPLDVETKDELPMNYLPLTLS